ncbi:MAG: phosphatidylserine decarboxylase [Methylococcaceae bacterium]|nr:phosphatidylserine decarboxylase [Methylococcaceae bacterium]
MRYLSEQHFFRDPARPMYSDTSYFFSPADGVILYQKTVGPAECLVEIKGKNYTLRQALRDDCFNQSCLVIGIFMSMYDVHVNRIPYTGNLSYKLLPAIETHNLPMLAVEDALLGEALRPCDEADYLFSNQRMLNKVYAPSLEITYYILQIADYDVATILPFELGQNHPFAQNRRFSQIRFGSQVDLIIPLSERWTFETLLPDRMHVEAGVDPLVRIIEK